MDDPSGAALLNPAFCGVLLYGAIDGYVKRKGQPIPFANAFLILPLVLHSHTRAILPKSVSSPFQSWVSGQPTIRVGLADRVRAAASLTREAMMYMIIRQCIHVEGASLGIGPEKPRMSSRTITGVAALRNEEFAGPTGRNYDFGEETLRLRALLSKARQEFQELQQQIQAANAFNNAQSLFEEEAQTQAARLEVVGLIPPTDADAHICPVCQSRLDDPVSAASDLAGSLVQLRTELEGVGSNRPRVDEYLNELGARQQEDRIAVQRMYKWLIESIQQAAPKEKFQLIIVDHADLNDSQFQGCVVERWRGDDALIPKDWVSSDEQPSQPRPG